MPSQKKERRKAKTTKCDMSVQVNLDEKRPTRHPQPRGSQMPEAREGQDRGKKGPVGSQGDHPSKLARISATHKKPKTGGQKFTTRKSP